MCRIQNKSSCRGVLAKMIRPNCTLTFKNQLAYVLSYCIVITKHQGMMIHILMEQKRGETHQNQRISFNKTDNRKAKNISL